MSRPVEDWEPVSGASRAILIGGSADALEAAPKANVESASTAKGTLSVLRARRDMGLLFGEGEGTGRY
jgi:hypothetical protein